MRNRREGHTIFGDLITQKRGLLALPILVLRAQEHRTITFQELGNAIGFSNHWRLGPALGYINTTHYELERNADWEYGNIPCITTIVITKGGQPSAYMHSQLGPISWENYKIHHIDPVFEYPHWGQVINYILNNRLRIS